MHEIKASSAREMMHYGLLPTDCDVLVAGDDHGRVWIYDVNRCLCESRQGKKLEELKETQVCTQKDEPRVLFSFNNDLWHHV